MERGLRFCTVILLVALGLDTGVVARGPGSAEDRVPEGTQGKAPPAPQEKKEAGSRSVLRSSLAGYWYVGDKAQLAAEIRGYLDKVEGEPLAGVRALILPHAGYRWSGQVAACGVKQIAGRKFSRVVLIGPTHRVPMENVASVPAVTHYATPLGEVPLDQDFIRSLRKYPVFQSIAPAHQTEHSVQIQVPLLQQVLGQFKLVPIVVGQLDLETARTLARILRGFIDKETLVIASSDFTHYGPDYRYVPFKDGVAEKLKALDMGAFAAIKTRKVETFAQYIKDTGATVCGRFAIEVLLAMLPPNAEVQLLKYDTSGRKSGSYENSVSYLGIAFRAEWADSEPLGVPEKKGPLSKDTRTRLLQLARRTLEYVMKEWKLPTPDQLGIDIVSPMEEPRGVFVSLYKEGELRGCIGQIYPCRPLFKAVMSEVLNAAFRDQRFPRVQAAEVPSLRVEISVLTQPEPVPSYQDIVIGKHGIIIEKNGRRAVYLPQVAPKMGWDLPNTLSHLSRKAGLPADAWKGGASFTVFEAEVFGEAEG